jgi:YggT family protein
VVNLPVAFIEILSGLYVIFLLMRLFLDERFFFFHSVLMPIHRATEPVLRPFRAVIRPLPVVGDLSPAAAILVILLAKALLLAVLLQVAVMVAVADTFVRFLDFLAVVYLVMLVVTLAVPPSTGNPVGRFVFAMLAPLTTPLERLLRSWRKVVAVGLPLVLGVHWTLSFALKWCINLMGGAPFGRMPLLALSERMLFQLQASLLLLNTVIWFFIVVVIVQVIMSWLSPDPRNPLVLMIYAVTDPLLQPFQRLIPTIGGLDISPIFVILLLQGASMVWMSLVQQMI